MSASAVSIPVGAGVAATEARTGAVPGLLAALEHVREGREAPRGRLQEDGGQRGGVEWAECERVAGLACFLARGHPSRVAHLRSRYRWGGLQEDGGQRGGVE